MIVRSAASKIRNRIRRALGRDLSAKRERFQWNFMPLERRFMFDGDGLTVDPIFPAASHNDQPGIIAMMNPVAGTFISLSSNDGIPICSGTDESGPQILSYDASLPADSGEVVFQLEIPEHLSGRLQVGFDVQSAATIRLELQDGTSILTSTSAGNTIAELDIHISSGEYSLTVVNQSDLAQNFGIRFIEAASPVVPASVSSSSIGGIDVEGKPWDIVQGSFQQANSSDYVAFYSGDVEAGLVFFTTNDDGSLTELQRPTAWELATSGNPLDIEVADFDSDRVDDVAVLFQDRIEIYSYANLDTPQILSNLGTDLRSFAAGDLGNDGTIDLAVVDHFDNRVFAIFDPVTLAAQVDISNPTADELMSLGINEGRLYLLINSIVSNDSRLAVFSVDNQTFTLVGLGGPAPFDYEEARRYENGPGQVQQLTRTSDFQFAMLGVEDNRYGVVLVRTLYAQMVWSIDNDEPVYLRAEPAGELYDANGNGQLDLIKDNLGTALHFSGYTPTDNFGNLLEVEPYGTVFGIEPGDFNGDGRMDTLAGVQRADTYRIESVLGTSVGSFLYESGTSVLTSPMTVHAADFDRDNALDILSFARGGATDMLIGQGDGNFDIAESPEGVTLLFGARSNSVVADFNNDGRMDIAVVRLERRDSTAFQQALVVFLGLGDGSFVEVNRAALVGELRNDYTEMSLLAHDINNDGQLDFVIAYPEALSNDFGVRIDIFDNRLFFGPAQSASDSRIIVTPTSTILPTQFLTTGINNPLIHLRAGQLGGSNDLNSDLVLGFASMRASQQTDVLYRLTGNGQFGFQVSPVQIISNRSDQELVDFILYDVNGDETDDILVLKENELLIQIDGLNAMTVPVQIGGRFSDIALATDDSGRLALIDEANQQVVIASVDEFLDLNVDRIDLRANNPNAMFDSVVFDRFTDSGVPDLLLYSESSGEIVVYEGALGTNMVLPAESNPISSVVADLNGDGTLDFATVDRNGQLLIRTGMQSMGGDRISVSQPKQIDLNGAIVQQLDSIIRAGENRLLAVLRQGTQRTLVEIEHRTDANGDESFAIANVLYEAETNLRVATGDLDADNQSDVVLFDATNRSIMVSGNTVLQLDATRATDIVISEGRIIILDGLASTLTILAADGEVLGRQRANQASIAFDPSTSISLSRPASLQVADFNNDGLEDLAVLNRGEKSISILYGTANKLFTNPNTILLDHQPDDFTIGDYNGDGILDIVVLQTDERNYWEDFPTDFVNSESFENYGANPDLFNKIDEDIVFLFGDQLNGFTRTTLTTMELVAQGINIESIDADGNSRDDLFLTNQDGDVLVFSGTGIAIRPITTAAVETQADVTRIDEEIRLSVDSREFTIADGSTLLVVQAATANAVENHINVRDITNLTAGERSERDVANDISDLSPTDVRIATLGGDFTYVVYTVGASNQIVAIPIDSASGLLYRELTIATEVGTQPQAFELRDINGDGFLDAIVANVGSQDVSILFGASNANGGFTNGQRLAFRNFVDAGFSPTGISFADESVNSDLLVTFTNALGEVQFLQVENVGNGFFNDATPIAGPNTVSDVVFAGGDAFVLTLDGNFERFSFETGASQSIRRIGNTPTQLRTITIDGQERIGVATSRELAIFNLDSTVAALADISLISDLRDFVFHDPTGLLYLVDSNEVISTLELSLIADNLDRSGILANLASQINIFSSGLSPALFTSQLGDGQNEYVLTSLTGNNELNDIFNLLPPEEQLGVFLKEIGKFFNELEVGYQWITSQIQSGLAGLFNNLSDESYSAVQAAHKIDMITLFASLNTQAHTLLQVGRIVSDQLQASESNFMQDAFRWLSTINEYLEKVSKDSQIEFDFEANRIRVGDRLYSPDDEAIRQFLLLEGSIPSLIRLEDMKLLETEEDNPPDGQP